VEPILDLDLLLVPRLALHHALNDVRRFLPRGGPDELVHERAAVRRRDEDLTLVRLVLARHGERTILDGDVAFAPRRDDEILCARPEALSLRLERSDGDDRAPYFVGRIFDRYCLLLLIPDRAAEELQGLLVVGGLLDRASGDGQRDRVVGFEDALDPVDEVRVRIRPPLLRIDHPRRVEAHRKDLVVHRIYIPLHRRDPHDIPHGRRNLETELRTKIAEVVDVHLARRRRPLHHAAEDNRMHREPDFGRVAFAGDLAEWHVASDRLGDELLALQAVEVGFGGENEGDRELLLWPQH